MCHIRRYALYKPGTYRLSLNLCSTSVYMTLLVQFWLKSSNINEKGSALRIPFNWVDQAKMAAWLFPEIKKQSPPIIDSLFVVYAFLKLILQIVEWALQSDTCCREKNYTRLIQPEYGCLALLYEKIAFWFMLFVVRSCDMSVLFWHVFCSVLCDHEITWFTAPTIVRSKHGMGCLIQEPLDIFYVCYGSINRYEIWNCDSVLGFVIHKICSDKTTTDSEMLGLTTSAWPEMGMKYSVHGMKNMFLFNMCQTP